MCPLRYIKYPHIPQNNRTLIVVQRAGAGKTAIVQILGASIKRKSITWLSNRRRRNLTLTTLRSSSHLHNLSLSCTLKSRQQQDSSCLAYYTEVASPYVIRRYNHKSKWMRREPNELMVIISPGSLQRLCGFIFIWWLVPAHFKTGTNELQPVWIRLLNWRLDIFVPWHSGSRCLNTEAKEVRSLITSLLLIIYIVRSSCQRIFRPYVLLLSNKLDV